VHVVGRGIVFVDLALGQISMLGVAFGGFIEKDATLVSVIFTLAGAFLWALNGHRMVIKTGSNHRNYLCVRICGNSPLHRKNSSR
jgi:ABC-type Mn2+/Zn2+ transport system permease subunit